jgi:ABC-2 type transport system permease protein
MTVTALPVAGSVGLGVRLVANEALKGLQLAWARRGLWLSGVVVAVVFFLGIRLLVGGGHIVKPLLAATLPALQAYAVAQTAALQGSGGIAEEINGGTFAQSQLTRAPAQRQVIGRLAALAVEGLTAAVLLGLIFTVGFRIHYHLRPDSLVPAALVVLDALGYGLVILGLTVRVVSIGAITHVFNMAIQFLGGTFVPVSVFLHAMQIAAQFVPTTLGVQALNTTLSGRGLAAAWGDGNLPWLIVHATASLALGWVIYYRNIRRARRDGGL